MRIWGIMFFIFGLLSLGSCKNKDESTLLPECSSDYKQLIDSLRNEYRLLYTEHPDESVYGNFVNDLRTYVSKYSGYKCYEDGILQDKSSEITLMHDQLNLVKKKQSKVIYGQDDRIDLLNVIRKDVRLWASSTAAMISTSYFDSQLNIRSETFGVNSQLCLDEPFYDQINPARCSGFLIGEDLLVTAGHCVTSIKDCQATYWVFDFTSASTKMDVSNVFQCVEILSRSLNNTIMNDYALVRLDRKVTGRKPLSFRMEGKVDNAALLLVIGHPSGLPTKVTFNGVIRNNSYDHYFVTDLDTYGGNSGSAVIDSNTGQVEGILVRGENDFIRDTMGCYRSLKCTLTGCRGEDVTRITSVQGIPDNIGTTEARWGDWSSWSDCTNGYRSRERACVTSLDDIGNCEGEAQEIHQCLEYDDEALFTKIFDEETLPRYQSEIFSFSGYAKTSYIIAGKKFLELCGLHVYQEDENDKWLNYYIGDCRKDKSRFNEVYVFFEGIVTPKI